MPKLRPSPKFNFKKPVFLLGLALLAAGSAFALSVPARPSGFVHDAAGLLSESARVKIERTLEDFERETSNQVVVAIFPGLEGESLEDFSIRLAQSWKVGQKGKSNGVVLLIFKQDRAVRIEVGYGLEGVLPDVTANLIIRREIAPAFRKGDYDGGVTAAVQAILQATRGEYKAEEAAQDKFQKFAPLLFFLLVFYFLAPIIACVLAVGWSVVFFGFPQGFVIGIALAAGLMILRALLKPVLFGETLASKGSRGGWGGTWSGSSGGGRSWGGGFSGGGGSFGGGGSSGSW